MCERQCSILAYTTAYTPYVAAWQQAAGPIPLRAGEIIAHTLYMRVLTNYSDHKFNRAPFQ